MAVFRVERTTGYTVMSNHHLRNKELTLKAKGLLSQMLSLLLDVADFGGVLLHTFKHKADMFAVQLQKLCFHKLGGVVVPGDTDCLSRCAYRFKHEVNDFVQAVNVVLDMRVVNEVVILDIVLDDFPVYLYYALRDYGLDAQIGREDTPQQYIERLVSVFHELKRVLRPDGTFWLNIADTYCGTGSKGGYVDPKNPKGRNGQGVSIARKAAGCKQKDLIGIPWLLAFALRADGWYLRSDIIWLKENPMPESVKDRPSRCYEHVFLLTKSKQYYYACIKGYGLMNWD